MKGTAERGRGGNREKEPSVSLGKSLVYLIMNDRMISKNVSLLQTGRQLHCVTIMRLQQRDESVFYIKQKRRERVRR